VLLNVCSYFVLMVERKEQFKNVAFGGNWSEEILVNEELSSILGIIDMAANKCREKDVEDEALLNAMLYVRKNVEKGPMLCAAFFKALRIQDQNLRYNEVNRVNLMIRTWAGE
jgi:hypothetical protein